MSFKLITVIVGGFLFVKIRFSDLQRVCSPKLQKDTSVNSFHWNYFLLKKYDKGLYEND